MGSKRAGTGTHSVKRDLKGRNKPHNGAGSELTRKSWNVLLERTEMASIPTIRAGTGRNGRNGLKHLERTKTSWNSPKQAKTGWNGWKQAGMGSRETGWNRLAVVGKDPERAGTGGNGLGTDQNKLATGSNRLGTNWNGLETGLKIVKKCVSLFRISKISKK